MGRDSACEQSYGCRKVASQNAAIIDLLLVLCGVFGLSARWKGSRRSTLTGAREEHTLRAHDMQSASRVTAARLLQQSVTVVPCRSTWQVVCVCVCVCVCVFVRVVLETDPTLRLGGLALHLSR